MSMVGTAAVDSRVVNRPARAASLDTAGLLSSAKELRKADSVRSAGNVCHTASSGDCPPRSKRARREVETRVWEWLDVSVNREASLTIGGFDFGHMHLSEGSPATTALTTALDAPPCDTVEPCVSSLPDVPAVGESGCVSSKITPGQEQEGPSKRLPGPGRLGTEQPAGAQAGEAQDADEAMSRRQDRAANSSMHAHGKGAAVPASAPTRSAAQQPELERVNAAGPSDGGQQQQQQQPQEEQRRSAEGRRLSRQISRKRKHSVDAERQPDAAPTELHRNVSAEPKSVLEHLNR